MNRTTINGVVYESQYSMSIINNQVVCDGDYYINGKLQGKENEQVGTITTKTLDITNIKSLYNGLFSIELNVDSSIEKEELVVTASELAHKKMNLHFKRSELSIDSSDGISGQVKLVLYAKSLEKIVNSGVGDVFGYINTQTVAIENNGTGNVKLTGQVNHLSLNNSGVGNLNTLELFANKVSFDNSGVGNIKLTSHTVSGSMSGVGNVKYYADIESKISKSGIGSVKYLGVRQFGESAHHTFQPKNVESMSNNYTNKEEVSLKDFDLGSQNNTTSKNNESSGLLNSLSKKFKKIL